MTWTRRLIVFILISAATILRGHASDNTPASTSPLAEYERPFTMGEKEHWAFQPVKRPPIPDVGDQGWVQTPIDAFLLASLEEHQITPAPPADRLTLLRRVYFDLIGLPPTVAEQDRFVADTSPQAFEKVVDDLLARPQYGERWARHWLDLVRYAETNGYERDGAKPHAWRYRDYVIKAFNSDKPYDRFLIEQLAGDELQDSDAETQVATTFLRLGTWDDEPADPMVDRYDQLDDIIATTSTTFLALTVQCARCHAHKFEPITQVDYSRLLAIFEPLKRPQDGRTDLDRLVGTRNELADFHEKMRVADATIGDRREKIEQTRTRLRSLVLNENRCNLPPEALAAFQKPDAARADAEKELIKQHREAVDQAVTEAASDEDRAKMQGWEKEIQLADAARPPEPPRAYVWYEDTAEAPPTHLFVRGDPSSKAVAVGPGTPAILVTYRPAGLDSAPKPRDQSTGRRLWMAQWLANPDHPLTARVIVNRIWQHHFGDGIVSTESDFGIMGEEPTHPELLDWLATAFVEGGWRLKPLHRMIVLSSAYQMSATWNEAAAAIDADEKLRWRWKPRRLEAEAIRDAVLAVSGKLNPSLFGPSVFPEISEAVLQSQSKPGDGWSTSDETAASRRSIYIFVKRSLLVPELEVMDFPGSNSSCEQRNVSTIAPQALTLMNGKFMQAQAAALADRLQSESPDNIDGQVQLAYRLCYGRMPTPDELATAKQFLTEFAAEAHAEEAASTTPDRSAEWLALKAFSLVLVNSNEFAYLD